MGAAEAPDAIALGWLPLIGVLVGALAGGAAYGVSLVAPHPLAVATAFGLTIVLTGAMHLDGFLDGCDAFFASVTPERRLEILKDPRHGTFALAGLAVVGVAWLAALWSIEPARLVLALALSGAAARWGAVIHALWFPYGRAGASARAFERRPPIGMLAAGAIAIAALAFALGPRGWFAVVAALAAAAVALVWARGRLGGGVTGDAYGFAIVLGEVVSLMVLASKSA